nr:IRK-interacting protein-like [Ipomoea batatas]
MATSSSSKPPLSPLFTPIEEGNEEDEYSQGRSSSRAESTPSEYKHRPTPLHRCSEKRGSKKRSESVGGDEDSRGGVVCNKCRPSNRERISVVPLDNNNNGHGLNRNSLASPNGIFKSIFSGLVKKSPSTRLSEDGSSREEQWKIAVAELSHKLIQATRKRDEAVLEASRLKYSMAELEKKLNKLEVYCHNLKSGLEVCTNNNNNNNNNSQQVNFQCIKVGDQERVIQHFLVAVSDARSSIRLLSRSLTLQLRQIGAGKIHDRISQLLQPYDIKISPSRNSRGGLLYLEALMSRAFFEDFETAGFQKSSCNPVLNPMDRCAANFAAFDRLQGLKWEEVLSKGTRFFSEDFSKFCDRKMSEIVAMLSWNRAWPEPLLQAFFNASKAVWLVHLLANSVHPGLPIFRVDNKTRFDPVYMEDKGGDRARKLVPTMVRIMVTPGFYIYDNVVKCKVLCRYNNSSSGCNLDAAAANDNSNIVLTPSPT